MVGRFTIPTSLVDLDALVQCETIHKLQHWTTNRKTNNSCTIVILLILLEADNCEDSKYVISILLLCQFTKISTNYRDFAGECETIFKLQSWTTGLNQP